MKLLHRCCVLTVPEGCWAVHGVHLPEVPRRTLPALLRCEIHHHCLHLTPSHPLHDLVHDLQPMKMGGLIRHITKIQKK